MDSPSRPTDAQRWLRFRNTGTDIIPPFAVIGPQHDRDQAYDAVESNKTVDFALRLGRPHAAVTRDQDASLFYINGSLEVRPNHFARCTQTGMMQALIGYPTDSLPAWGDGLSMDTSQSSTPFYLVPGGGAYKFIDFDGCPKTTFKDSTRTGYTFKVGWIVPASVSSVLNGMVITDDGTLTTLETGDILPFDGRDNPAISSFGSIPAYTSEQGELEDRGFFRVTATGYYLLNASARIRALDAPINGNIGGGLQLTCRTNRIGPDEFQTADQIEAATAAGDLEEITTSFLRLHAEEQPADTQMVEGEATENHRHWQTVTGSTVLSLTEGELFFIYNPTGYQLEVSSVSATMVQLSGTSSGAPAAASSSSSDSSSGGDSGGGSGGGDSSELTGRVDTLESDVDDLESTVTAQGATISSQASTLASHTSSIAANASGVSSNASAISSAASDISDHETRITDLETFETSATASIASNASAISTNTADIGTNAADIATNAADIATNASAIGALETFETSATASIAANASDIDDLETFQATTEAIFAGAIADGTYVTGALDELTTAGGIVTDFTASSHLGVIGGSTDTNKNYKFGWNALQALTTGTYNVAIGLNAGYNLTSGTHNVCLGRYAGNTHTTGDNCVFIGEYSGQHLSSGDDQLAIGFGPTQAEHWIIGDSSGNVTIPGQLTADGVNLVTYTASIAAAVAVLADDIEDLEDIHAAAIADGTYETAGGDEITVADGVVTAFSNGKGRYGFTISNNTSDADHDLDIAAGACLSHDRTTWIAGSAMTKRFDAAWAAGNGNGGMDTGSIPTSGGLYLYAIYHPSNGVDYIGSTAAPATGPSLPTGYTKYAYIGYRPTDSSANFLPVVQKGNYHEIQDEILAEESVNPGTADNDVTCPVPEGAVVMVWMFVRNTNPGNSLSRIFFGTTDATASIRRGFVDPANGLLADSQSIAVITAPGSDQIRYRVDASFATLLVALRVTGWVDHDITGLGV
ncbi:hypothetical protein AB1K70_19440 [Bremerella sp. JC770]|uniref:hypothetical protein n=1 Tax=Bremerella sp. JC770 TaxID=3232137 RepID=UPI00345933A4